ncbi:MAG: hypothetical protein R2845_15035 [Thermomicrobiales bacterium]
MKATIEGELGDFEAEVNCLENVALLAAVGEGVADEPTSLAKLLGALRRHNVSVLAANQQASNVALIAAIPEKDAKKAVDAAHAEFIRSLPASSKGRRPRRNEMIAGIGIAGIVIEDRGGQMPSRIIARAGIKKGTNVGDSKRIPVAVLGATGSVGQRFVQLLADHPWFEVAEVVASEALGRPQLR